MALKLILCGSGHSEWYDEMIAFYHETQHEKIIDGLAIGIAIMHYRCEDRANGVINAMIVQSFVFFYVITEKEYQKLCNY